MSSFRPVNTTLAAPEGSSGSGKGLEETTPTTPRPNARFSDQPPKEIPREESVPSTPTRHNFGGVPGQRPLPSAPFTPSHGADAQSELGSGLTRENSHRSVHSHQSSDSQDVDMADDDDGQEASDNESVTSDSQRPSKKKKKGQRFFCTDFPPCTLSFTRSEHLARHIRKHTGERPFQCHCSRRFSRLDNLRQHAQTVHVNEEIPGDSLAATGTRFQRQIRTDRVRPPNSRSRASTMGSQGGGHSRGHSRNLSASSVTSTASSVGIPDDVRRRPPPLAMAQDGTARARLSLDTFNPQIGSPGPQYGYYNPQSPGGYSTPTSATFSTGASSPRFSSGLQSPSALSRSSFYNGSRTPARRLSVPSGVSPYQAAQGPATYPPVYLTPMQSSTSSVFPPGTSVYASPTSSIFSHGRRDSEAEMEYRRRTWHPGTYTNYVARPATSGLSYHQTPDDSKPEVTAQPAASQVTRLPGIESFDHAPPPPVAAAPPSRQISTPMQVDALGKPSVYPGVMDSSASGPDDRKNLPAWEAGLHQNLTKLDIATSTPPKEGQGWMEQARPQHRVAGERPFAAPQPGYAPQQLYAAAPPGLQPAPVFGEQAVNPRKTKRQAWYGGPIAAPSGGSQPIYISQRTSPDDSGSSEGVPTPSTSQGRELHPVILHPNGVIEMQPAGTVMTEEQHRMAQAQAYNKPEPVRTDSGFQPYMHAPGGPPHGYVMQAGRDIQAQPGYAQFAHRSHNDMGRLEALVAVATSENRAVEPRT